jgi:hypothetical protein
MSARARGRGGGVVVSQTVLQSGAVLACAVMAEIAEQREPDKRRRDFLSVWVDQIRQCNEMSRCANNGHCTLPIVDGRLSIGHLLTT